MTLSNVRRPSWMRTLNWALAPRGHPFDRAAQHPVVDVQLADDIALGRRAQQGFLEAALVAEFLAGRGDDDTVGLAAVRCGLGPAQPAAADGDPVGVPFRRLFGLLTDFGGCGDDLGLSVLAVGHSFQQVGQVTGVPSSDAKVSGRVVFPPRGSRRTCRTCS